MQLPSCAQWSSLPRAQLADNSGLGHGYIAYTLQLTAGAAYRNTCDSLALLLTYAVVATVAGNVDFLR